MKRTIIIELEIEDNADAAAEAVDAALDAGTIQSAILDADAREEFEFSILSATSRLETEEESAPLAPVVANPPPCSLRAGWGYFNDQEVQRDDEEALFETDFDARAHIRGCSFCLMDLMVEADGLPVEPLLSTEPAQRPDEDANDEEV